MADSSSKKDAAKRAANVALLGALAVGVPLLTAATAAADPPPPEVPVEPAPPPSYLDGAHGHGQRNRTTPHPESPVCQTFPR